jgi:cytosine/adenosine deaminase-related metal-dependent hydrolase
MATRGGAKLLGRDDIGHLAPGMSADFIAVKLNQLGLSGTQRDPLAAMIMCGPFKVDFSYINGRAVISGGAFVRLDVAKILEEHAAVVRRIYQ